MSNFDDSSMNDKESSLTSSDDNRDDNCHGNLEFKSKLFDISVPSSEGNASYLSRKPIPNLNLKVNLPLANLLLASSSSSSESNNYIKIRLPLYAPINNKGGHSNLKKHYVSDHKDLFEIRQTLPFISSKVGVSFKLHKSIINKTCSNIATSSSISFTKGKNTLYFQDFQASISFNSLINIYLPKNKDLKKRKTLADNTILKEVVKPNFSLSKIDVKYHIPSLKKQATTLSCSFGYGSNIGMMNKVVNVDLGFQSKISPINLFYSSLFSDLWPWRSSLSSSTITATDKKQDVSIKRMDEKKTKINDGLTSLSVFYTLSLSDNEKVWKSKAFLVGISQKFPSSSMRKRRPSSHPIYNRNDSIENFVENQNVSIDEKVGQPSSLIDDEAPNAIMDERFDEYEQQRLHGSSSSRNRSSALPAEMKLMVNLLDERVSLSGQWEIWKYFRIKGKIDYSYLTGNWGTKYTVTFQST